jgi:hypothetical protein
MTSDTSQKNQNNSRQIKRQHVAGFYIFLVITSVIVMIVAAVMTYGYQQREVRVSYERPQQKKTAPAENAITISPNLSHVPSDKIVEDILNDVLPNVCDDCDDDPLNCLEEATINKIVIANEGYQDQLLVEVLTGKSSQKYTAVINLQDHTVISHSGKIDEKECFEPGEKEIDPDVLISPGLDPEDSKYVDVPAPQQ